MISSIFDPKSQKFFSNFFPLKILRPFYNHQDIYNQTHYIMDIQQYIFNNTGVLLPISGGNGQSQDQAVVIDSKAKYMFFKWVDYVSVGCYSGYYRLIFQTQIFLFVH